ncbi:MAG: ATP-dependent protease LonB [Desulfitobacteriaceae bacterium]|nr:ATP-dependent protease LonB [Desulfitobacteriaceae bacterium]MDD4345721.1 ATP-dependent protease LonB [Desulfitobacteriaceae bacterium]MDD4400421.1 ATP-dependent protease LonB [Desulfitobacteriaceae bacterium]
MLGLSGLVMIIQLIFAVVIGLYFWGMLKAQHGNKVFVEKDSHRELQKLERMRKIVLTTPLAEKTRPKSFSEIIGQAEGIRALRAALCGPNPQHVIIYGPPGIGKTAAARLVLEEARKNQLSPFKENAHFIEIDGATARFDERGIADPLIGSVHDPIYQGAGAMGMAGIPQPKAGAVTKAHGGILFVDEIGELHPIQINKLLKVLEDRKVILESSYYSYEDPNIPAHIHDIFQNGLPADFRLVGATTRSSHEIPPAIRSRCMEIFFRALLPAEIAVIARGAAEKMGISISEVALEVVKNYAANGREAVNIVQLAAGVAQTDEAQEISAEIIEWVVVSGRYVPRNEKKISAEPLIGVVNGLAVYGPEMGTLLELEVTAHPVSDGCGEFHVTGIVEEEELEGSRKRIRRKSMARSSIENVLTVLRKELGIKSRDYNIHINFPGGVPIDGPSAGIAIAVAIVSAIRQQKVDNYTAMTGEVSIQGKIKPVGGIIAKIEAARQAGCLRVLIPAENWQERFGKEEFGIKIIPVAEISEVLTNVLIVMDKLDLIEKSEQAELKPSLEEILARLDFGLGNLPDRGKPC